jgi:hypothetical protein
MKTLTLISLMLVCAVSFADSEKENCRLTIRTTFQDGHKKIDVTAVEAVNQEDCKQQGEEKKLELQKEHDSNVKEIIISTGWGGPS